MVSFDNINNSYSSNNSLLNLIIRMFSNIKGILFALVPLVILVGLFFLIKYKTKNKNIIIIYSIIATIIYLLYFWKLLNLFTMSG